MRDDPVGIVLIDDAPDVRALVRVRLGLTGEFVVLGEGQDGEEAIELASRHRPALMLLDVSMPKMDGLEALPRVLAASPSTRVVMFSGFTVEGLLDRAMALGAADFVEKAIPIDALAERLKSALAPQTAAVARARDAERLAEPRVPVDSDQAVLDAHLERFRGVFDAAAIGMATMTLTGRIVRANATLGRLLGQPLEELAGTAFRDLVDDDTSEAVKRAISVIVAGASTIEQLEHRLTRVGAAPIWVLSTIAVVQDDSGRPLYVFLQVQDVTARRMAEEAGRENETRFRLLVDAVTDYAVFMLDPHGRIASWNVGAERIRGYRADEVVGRHYRMLYPPEAQAANRPQLGLEQAVKNGRFEEEDWRVRRDGSRFWAHVVITALFDDDGSLLGFGEVTQDRSDRQPAE